MDRKRITCPESGHLEEIDVERTPFGLVIAACSRFEPRGGVMCPGECARRMDRRARQHDDERGERVLVVYARAAYTRPVAEALAHELARDGLVVELADLDERAAPPPHDYDAVIVGSAPRLGTHPRTLVAYVADHRDALAAMPTFLIAVGRGGADVGRMRRETGWLPARAFAIERPAWHVRWFGDPNGVRAPRVHELALAIAEEIPAREAT